MPLMFLPITQGFTFLKFTTPIITALQNVLWWRDKDGISHKSAENKKTGISSAGSARFTFQELPLSYLISTLAPASSN
jgi:hypothetical protein